MISEHNINEWAERYLSKSLSEAELQQMNKALDNDPELYRQWIQSLEILRTFESAGERKAIRNLIQSVADHKEEWAEDAFETSEPKATVIPFRKYLRTTAAAAALILCSSLATMLVVNKKGDKVDQKTYQQLVREVSKVKAQQSKIIDSLNKNKDAGEQVVPQDDEIAMYGGTGFAISNDGYLATNYHVVEKAESIYVQTPKGDKKAYIVARDPKADIAILKLEDKSYRFGKSLPYNISKPVSGLGQRVFSIGYPKDEVVYNEGYISCENGYEGDQHSYQLEMTANPGQSGSPVMDKYGSIVGVITGKLNNSAGTTYAVHADALIELVQSLPKSAGIRLPEVNKMSKMERTEQVKKMRDYVFSIRVN